MLAYTAGNIDTVSPVTVYVANEFTYVRIICITLIHSASPPKIEKRRGGYMPSPPPSFKSTA